MLRPRLISLMWRGTSRIKSTSPASRCVTCSSGSMYTSRPTSSTNMSQLWYSGVKTGKTVERYLNRCKRSDKAKVTSSSKDFKDRRRYKNNSNTIATTWFVARNSHSVTKITELFLRIWPPHLMSIQATGLSCSRQEIKRGVALHNLNWV